MSNSRYVIQGGESYGTLKKQIEAAKVSELLAQIADLISSDRITAAAYLDARAQADLKAALGVLQAQATARQEQLHYPVY